MRRMRGPVVALLIGMAARLAGANGAPQSAPYDPTRDPALDLANAREEARREEKRVLLQVGGNWCGWCREFDRFVHADAAVAEALRCAFVVVHVNVSPENGNARFLSAYPGVPGYPYLIVLDADGRVLATVDTDDFLNGEAYDRGKFLKFARKFSAAP